VPSFECCLLIIHDWYTLNHFDITCVKDVVFLMGIGVSFVTNKLAKYKKTKKFLAHLSRVRYLGVRYLGLQVHFSLQETHPHQPLHQVLILHYQLIQERCHSLPHQKSLQHLLTRRAYNICSPQHLDDELQTVRHVCLQNGFPPLRITTIMDEVHRKFTNPPRHQSLASFNRQTRDHALSVSLPFHPSLSKPISKILGQHDIKVTHSSATTLRNLLTKT